MEPVRYPPLFERWIRRCGATIFLVFLGMWSAHAEGVLADGSASPSLRVVVLVSRHIRPYLEAVEGVKTGLSEGVKADIRVMELADLDDREKGALARRLSAERLNVLVGIGPEAGLFVFDKVSATGAVRLYLMVLNPDKVFGFERRVCGVSLNIPVPDQVEVIRRGLPSVVRIGLLYDPQINSDVFREASRAASAAGLHILPLTVTSKRDIPSVLGKGWGDVDALWLIPDRTVVSESIVHYVIKEAFLRKVPVIGFNRFFYEAGAAMAFVLDYEALGRECAEEALQAVTRKVCGPRNPVFDVWINRRVVEKLGLKTPETYAPPMRWGP